QRLGQMPAPANGHLDIFTHAENPQKLYWSVSRPMTSHGAASVLSERQAELPAIFSTVADCHKSFLCQHLRSGLGGAAVSAAHAFLLPIGLSCARLDRDS